MKHGRVSESMWYFERSPYQSVVSWTAAICGLVQNGLTFKALLLFRKLLEAGVRPNQVTFTSVVRACAVLCDSSMAMSVLGLIVKLGFETNVSVSNSLITLGLRLGKRDLAKQVFDRMEERDVVSWTAILDMHVEMGDLAEARRISDEMPERNEISWSAMIARYSQSGYPEEGLKLFSQMVQNGFTPTMFCFSSVISALASLRALHAGMNIHAHVLKFGIQGYAFICSSLIDLYCKCGMTRDARLLFDMVPQKNVVSWNSMISGYSQNREMDEARKLFDNMPIRDYASWNCVIAGYLENKQFDEVFELFNEMLLSGEIPTKSTFSSVLCACSNTASLEKGKYLHGKTVKLGSEYDTFVGTALMDMYAKSGDIDSSKKVFDRIREKTDVSWTVMIQGLAENGFAEEVLDLFKEMERTTCWAPNEIMLLSVLFACAHTGLIDEGLRYFSSMETVYGIKPKGRHYNCVVDMLSRSGRLSEAEEFIRSMPFEAETNAWAALLSGCNRYKNDRLADTAARKLLELGENNSGRLVLLSNIYASAGRWIDVLNVRKLMKEEGLKKNTGFSWIEVRNRVHAFYSADGAHTKSAEIFEILQLISTEIQVLQSSSAD